MATKDLIKRLSHSSEQSIRDKAMEELEVVVKDQQIKFEDIELRMVFEGIFYCFWHSDKPRYQEVLATKIANFTDMIKKEEHVLMWVRYFFKCICLHWDRIDTWRINKYLSLIRKQLVVVFKHLQKTLVTNPERIKEYMDAIYEESLKDKDVPLGVGMQMADIYIEEMSKCFDKQELTHERVTQLLNPFLQALGKAQQLVLFQRIKEKVFVKLLECNGVDADENGDLYFPKFDIIDYAESDLFKLASDKDTIESRREDIYKLYEKAAGRERPKDPELSYAEKLQMMKVQAKKMPMTKNQKKKFMRDKVKKITKMKKRILKMIRNQQLQLFSNQNGEENSKVEGIEAEGPEDARLESITKGLLDRMNLNVQAKEALSAPVEDLNDSPTEDKVVEISQKPQKKKKNRKRKAEVVKSKQSSKKVVFELDKNTTKEFYMHGKVGLTDKPKSKEIKVKTPGIIKKRAQKM